MLTGLVQQHQGGRSRQGPGQQEPTSLSTGQRCGIGADDGLDAVGKSLEPVPQAGPPQQVTGLGGGDVPARHAQVLQDTGVEDVRVLRGQAHPGRHIGAGRLPRGDTVERQRAAPRLQQSRQRGQQCRLADPRRPYDRHSATDPQIQVDALGHNRAARPAHRQAPCLEVRALGGGLGQLPGCAGHRAAAGSTGLGRLDELHDAAGGAGRPHQLHAGWAERGGGLEGRQRNQDDDCQPDRGQPPGGDGAHPDHQIAQDRDAHGSHIHGRRDRGWYRGPVPQAAQVLLPGGDLAHRAGQAPGDGQLRGPLQDRQDLRGQLGGLPLTGLLGDPRRTDGGQRAHQSRQQQAGQQDEARRPVDQGDAETGGRTQDGCNRRRQIGAHDEIPDRVDVAAHPRQDVAATQARNRVRAGRRQGLIEAGAQSAHASQGGVMGDEPLAVAQDGARDTEEPHRHRRHPQRDDVGHLGGPRNEPGRHPGQGHGRGHTRRSGEHGQDET